ncbi:MAG: FAD-binding oxidoreductase, partial [Promethearchaeota archaeon]
MTLQREIFKEFEDVVGEGNIDDGDVVTNVYAYNWCTEIFNYMEGKEPIPFSPVPKAVVLPSTTEQVQKLIKLCNKYTLKFKAQSTGLGPWNQPSTDNCIIFDMRRMNKIVKIDEKNLYAVIEPYVTGAQLQVEVMKYGLNCHMSGAGPQVSPLASSTSMNGPGFTSPSTGYSARNVLAVEWVLPGGEIMKLGSYGLNNNPDWFHGDGPGPSLRGIMRGYSGTKSGLGVFTKVAVKLFPFPCSSD